MPARKVHKPEPKIGVRELILQNSSSSKSCHGKAYAIYKCKFTIFTRSGALPTLSQNNHEAPILFLKFAYAHTGGPLISSVAPIRSQIYNLIRRENGNYPKFDAIGNYLGDSYVHCCSKRRHFRNFLVILSRCTKSFL